MKKFLLFTALLSLPLFGLLFWRLSSPPSLTEIEAISPTLGTKVIENLSSLPTLPITEDRENFVIKDTRAEGIEIQYANTDNPEGSATSKEKSDFQEQQSTLSLSFPKDSSKPLEVKLDETRTIPITHLDQEDYALDTLTAPTNLEVRLPSEGRGSWWERLFGSQTSQVPPTYLRYQGDRKTLLYAYEKDQATGEKRLKHWTIYETGTGLEEERYHLENVKLKISEEGKAEVFFYGEQNLKNDQAAAEVEPSLLERAQRTLEKELGSDFTNQTPDFIIPKPYYLDNQGEKHDLEWQWNEETKILSVSINLESLGSPASKYPIALDPTLSFTAPGQSNTGSVIDGETTNNYFGWTLTTGDLNSDGRTDLAVGAYGYSTSTGRAYIFYSDGSIPTTAATADVTITGEATNNFFGSSLASGDFNADGRTDLAVGAYGYSSSTGRTYIFYSDGSLPTTAATADVLITGEGTNELFGASLAAGDFNADGKIDLAVGALAKLNAGRVYLFYNDGSIPTTAATADVKIDCDATTAYFSWALVSGDFNSDGRIDIAVAASVYALGTYTGRVYIFNNDGSYPASVSGADVSISGETSNNYFGQSLAAGDFNADGRTDLAVGATGYSTNTGRTYLFYNDGSIPTTAATADVIVTGETTSNFFGSSLVAGDFNADGRTDLAVGAYGYSSNTGRAYIFYNDGSIPTTAATADVTITGEATNNRFGISLTSGDFNADGRTDLAVGAYGYSSFTGRTYIFYSQNGQVNTNFSITGNATSDQFGYAMTTGDFNADGRTDLIVGASGYSTNTGRAYIFYGDGQIPTAAGSADVTITGETTSNLFGTSLTSGDFNADGRTDLVVGANGYATNTGRAYIFYNDGSIPTTAATADVTITGETTNNYFGISLTSGDFNADGRTDLVVAATGYSTNTGRAYIFYSDGSIPTTAGTADVTITGEATSNNFGISLTSGDFNADGRTDLAVGAYGYSTSTGRAYIFYNDGSIPTTAATADVTITGEATGNYFGYSLTSGDFNADGRTDLAVGASGYSSDTGKVYLYETRENFAWEIQKQPQPGSGALRTGLNTSGQELRITGEATGGNFSWAMVSGDFNSDGKLDLAVGAYGYSSNTGRAYIFYNDGSLPVSASGADVVITGGATSSRFGNNLAAGDLNRDGRTDLVVGGYNHSQLFQGALYIFYNDGLYPATAASADAKITGGNNELLGIDSIVVGDFDTDGDQDLAAAESQASTNAGKVYIFYNDGSYPSSVASADIAITGETGSKLGTSLAAGDFNTDGRTDLAVGSWNYTSSTGRAYIFYNDGSSFGTVACTTDCLAANADVIITGQATSNTFSTALIVGDFNSDGRTDLAASAPGYSSGTGRIYIFYNDGSSFGTVACTTDCLAANADVSINGVSSNTGAALTAGDMNSDGRIDLIVGSPNYSSQLGRWDIIYNDGSYPASVSSSDLTGTGEATSSFYGTTLLTGDFSGDGKTDLVVGSYNYSSIRGRVYVYTFGNDPVITGETTGDYFGNTLVTGDFNADGKTDLAASSYTYSSATGRVYIFYNDGSLPTTAATADVTITGGAPSDGFGLSLTVGDFDFDGRIDLAVGANGYSGATGRAYIFYNDGSIPTTAGTADVTITGNAAGDQFGRALTAGDLNSDGRTDLVVSASGYSSSTGRVYLFYNDGSIPTTAATADVTITGTAASTFGQVLQVGDMDADGDTDLIVFAPYFQGYVAIYYNDGSYPTTLGTADVTIIGENNSDTFGISLVVGDFNADGKKDLAVLAPAYSSATGRTYVFYNDGSYPASAASADAIITGTTTSLYMNSLASSDLNFDGKDDLIVGAYGTPGNTYTGQAYIFYGGSITTETVSGADMTIAGSSGTYFGYTVTVGDLNADGKTDLIVGGRGYSSNTGRVYVFASETAPTSAQPAASYLKGTGTLKGTAKLR